MARIKKIVFWIPGVIWAALLYAGQVGPDEAQTNLGKWAVKIGVNKWPHWLTDTRAIVLGTVAVVAFYAWVIWRHHQASAQQKRRASVAIASALRQDEDEDDAINQLSRLRAEGTHLLGTAREIGRERWDQDLSDWYRRLSKHLNSAFTEAEFNRVDEIGSLLHMRMSGALDNDHNKQLMALARRLEILEEIISQHTSARLASRRPDDRPAQSAEEKRVGADIEGGTTRLRKTKIRNQDVGLRTKDTDLDAEDTDIE